MRIAPLALLSILAACGPAQSPGSAGDVDLPGVDTASFTPREKHEFSDYVRALPAPCRDVAVPIAQCVIEKRACAQCLPAAIAIARAVREGLGRHQVEELYKARFDASSVHAIDLEGSPSRGPESAPVVVVEFADFECPFCQRIAPDLDAVWEAHKDRVRFVYKFLPLSMHPHGDPAARAAIAAHAQGKFWPMEKLLFASGSRLEASDLEGYARSLGLDVAKFASDMRSAETKARLDADRRLADALGVRGTPTLFVNGRQLKSKDDLEDWIESAIDAANRAGGSRGGDE